VRQAAAVRRMFDFKDLFILIRNFLDIPVHLQIIKQWITRVTAF